MKKIRASLESTGTLRHRHSQRQQKQDSQQAHEKLSETVREVLHKHNVTLHWSENPNVLLAVQLQIVTQVLVSTRTKIFANTPGWRVQFPVVRAGRKHRCHYP